MPKGSVLKPQQQERAIQNGLTALAKDIQVDFGVATQTWQHRPQFRITQPAQYERTVETDDRVFSYVELGTRPHIIRPRKRRLLRFTTPFQSKTLPNQIMSRAGSKGNAEVLARVVRHPGTKARHFAKAIAMKWTPQAPIVMQRAIDAEFR